MDISMLVAAAKHEWQHWGFSKWTLSTGDRKIGHRDDEPEYAQYVIKKYCKVGGGSPTVEEIQNDDYAWSAVGMSAIMSNAGLTKAQFPFAQSHSVYIRRFIKARKAADPTALYWGLRNGEHGAQPAVGDLVAYARGSNMTKEKAAKLYDSTSAYNSHTDLVVATRPGEIDVIGANVMDSVTLKTLKLDAGGHIADQTHAWFAVLKLHEPHG